MRLGPRFGSDFRPVRNDFHGVHRIVRPPRDLEQRETRLGVEALRTFVIVRPSIADNTLTVSTRMNSRPARRAPSRTSGPTAAKRARAARNARRTDHFP